MNGWGRRHRHVYAYDVADLRAQGRPIRVGYVGKSSSDIRYRDAQHRAGKDWAWAICGPIYHVWEGDCGRVALWIREVYFIRKLRPMFNVEHNRHNTDRIPPWQASRLYARHGTAYDWPIAR